MGTTLSPLERSQHSSDENPRDLPSPLPLFIGPTSKANNTSVSYSHTHFCAVKRKERTLIRSLVVEVLYRTLSNAVSAPAGDSRPRASQGETTKRSRHLRKGF